ncbi:neutral zinc metallopeptidase [Pseudonocardia sp. KRD-184]|uniref:Neutral zinc metallopeptidase n=1 Tax=Pseudonocardia oceani TaxID=2792013 RepID=A0ABS6U5Z2_9PSEU|nr:neutral zinc metallopeptidase [Pseudonocardia oceani]MBW0093018.1 neutral zinc metallopeptidase [Pseudonocardia oceani]MBW0097390.1 neutral zinc metallopeptidase [Pseudonocardia oceani]MBW0111557.1 neutral zinc metallopeptidase [Pseudonocardia oceani]MBW0124164.1 neutral zinc metallopeptidase [Pseudonocardia oceani]MBW0127579.1 neutral zinc metallopeptidase [Pseudonocardia oceani]
MRAVLVLLLALVLVGCTQAVPGRGVAADLRPPAPAVVPPVADAGSAATAVTAAVEGFWRTEFPASFGQPWDDIRTLLPVSPGEGTPPCVQDLSEVADQAYYCPAADAVVWDAAGLVPDLFAQFGHVGVVVVLAHEIGHAVETRLGLDEAQARDPDAYPTILLEAMADCYTGVVVRRFSDVPVPGLPIGTAERDAALRTLVGFRDPLGVAAGDEGAHGNAFDRVSAFRAGYDDGATRCAEMTVPERGFTQVRFGSAADQARAGDLPLRDLLAAIGVDAREWATELSGVAGWTAPPLTTDACPEAAAQGPARLCATADPLAEGAVDVDLAALAPLHTGLGDFAGATLVTGRYGLAALRAAGSPVEGVEAGHAAVCLAGAYSGQLLVAPVDFRLSPGDLDEAVQVLLADDWAARDASGRADPTEHGYERVARYEDGLRGGPAVC